MSTFVYAANEAEMTIKPEEEKIANLIDTENIETDIGINQVPSLKTYGLTLVNLAGKSTGYTPYDFNAIERLNLDPSTGD